MRTNNGRDIKLLIESALLQAIDLRDSVFEIGDEPLIRTMDLLIYALGTVAARNRLEQSHADHGRLIAKERASAA